MVAGMSFVGIATSASAQGVPVPTGQTFSQCPVGHRVSPGNGSVYICVVGVAEEGTIDIGALDTTFKGPGVVQGGTGSCLCATLTWAQALDGVSYSAPKQLLAMSVLALLGYPSGITPPAQSQVYVETVQAGPMLFGIANGGVVTVVPLSFRLVNPLLGSNCYVGTLSDPVVLNLTTATSGSLTGTLGYAYSFAGVLYTVGTEVVDNQFTVPAATGCGSGGVWDSAITALEGADTPGSNSAILYGNYALATAKWVKHQLHT